MKKILKYIQFKLKRVDFNIMAFLIVCQILLHKNADIELFVQLVVLLLSFFKENNKIRTDKEMIEITKELSAQNSTFTLKIGDSYVSNSKIKL